MRVLLPPSETKRPGGRGRSLDRRAPHPLLGGARAQLLDALKELLAGPPPAAAGALLLPPAVVHAALIANARVRTSPTMPALRRYAGVVYDGLGHDSLLPREKQIAARSVLVFSGLFGVVRGDEPVPDYRVPATSTLPGIGVAATFWKKLLTDAVPQLLDRGLVVDLRSSDYAPMWRPGPNIATRVVQVRVLSAGPSGPAVISHPSKLAKGRLTAALVRRIAAGGAVADVEDVASAWLDAGGARAVAQSAGQLVIHTD